MSDQIIRSLYAWGVRPIYGYSGEGINRLIGSVDRAEGRIRFIQTRHEEIAAFMACGPDGLSCREQVCQLGHVRAKHLAEIAVLE